MIGGVRKVVLTVSDQDQAKEFWTKAMGFEVQQDSPYGPESRWLEVKAPGDDVVLVLEKGQPNQPSVADGLPHSNVIFSCSDLVRTHQELIERGVTFVEAPAQHPWGWWSVFQDQDGTRYALSQDE